MSEVTRLVTDEAGWQSLREPSGQMKDGKGKNLQPQGPIKGQSGVEEKS